MSSNLKIGIMGSASLGKSTTSEILGRRLNLEVHKELESRLIKKLIKRGIIEAKNSFTPSQSKEYQNRSLNIRDYLSRRKRFISDRTAGELWVYHQMYCGPHSTISELDEFKGKCKEIMGRYTHLFLFPFGQIPIVDDNYRNIDPIYQEKVHKKIEKMLDNFNLDYVQLTKQPFDVEERVQEILGWIKK